MKTIFASLVVAISIPALGSVSISREYAFSRQLLSSVEQHLAKAAARDSEMQEFSLAITVNEANRIMLWCPPHMPKVDGTGCSLSFLN
jgi:hypothetical protein